MTVRQRLLKFLKSQKLGQNAFETKVGWSNGYISNTKEPSITKLNMVFNEYPNLSKDWLINGNGEMFNDNTSYETLKSEINDLRTRISLLEKIILEK